MPNPVLGTITTEVTEAVGAMNSATVLVNGIQGLIDAAVAASIGNGATEAELAPFTQLSADLDASANALAAAVAAHPGPVVEPPPVEPSARRK